MSEGPEQAPANGPAACALLEELDRRGPLLRHVSESLFERPELSGQEDQACSLLARLLGEERFEVDSSIPGLPTAFVAKSTLGKGGPPRIALFCEYDALPGLGHACGHNLIASASLTAGVALSRSAKSESGEVWVIGSPAEETFGGKISLLAAGRLQGLDAAMMFHPGAETRVCSLESVATEPLEISFYRERIPGLEMAIDANPVLAVADLFRAIALVASQFGRNVRYPGVIREAGERPNVVPERATARFSFRAASRAALRRFVHEVYRCVRGVAQTSGCSFSMRRYEPGYEPILVSKTIGRVCEEYLAREGLEPLSTPPEAPGAYDIGSLSQQIPVIHPIISKGFEGVQTHTVEFAARAGSEGGLECARVAARVLALTALRLLRSAELVADSKRELSERVGS